MRDKVTFSAFNRRDKYVPLHFQACHSIFTFYFSALIFQSQTWRQFTKVDGLPSNQFLTMIEDQQDNFRVGMPCYISCINEGIVNETFQISQGKYGRSEIYCDGVNNGCLCWMW